MTGIMDTARTRIAVLHVLVSTNPAQVIFPLFLDMAVHRFLFD